MTRTIDDTFTKFNFTLIKTSRIIQAFSSTIIALSQTKFRTFNCQLIVAKNDRRQIREATQVQFGMISAVESSISKSIMFYTLLKMIKIANIYQVKHTVTSHAKNCKRRTSRRLLHQKTKYEKINTSLNSSTLFR